MKKEKNKDQLKPDNEEKITPGYPKRPASKDVDNNLKDGQEINPENISKVKIVNKDKGPKPEK